MSKRVSGWLVISLALVCVLDGCATKGGSGSHNRYPNYRAMTAAQMDLKPWGDLPPELADQVGACAADVGLQDFSKTELERLDRYARGEVDIPAGELKKINARISDRVGNPQALKSEMELRCPTVVRAARQYKRT